VTGFSKDEDQDARMFASVMPTKQTLPAKADSEEKLAYVANVSNNALRTLLPLST
jgi:hypothetical protein